MPSAYRVAWANALTVDNIVKEAQAMAFSGTLSTSKEAIELKADDVIVDFSALHMGMKDRNPMELVHFYSKNTPKSTYRSLER